MKKTISLMLLSSLLATLAGLAQAAGLTLDSPDVRGQLSEEQVFNGFGCEGKNISPELNWSDAPQGTQSFALTVYDPDAPTGSGWWHWLIFDIPASVQTLARGAGNPDNASAPESSIQSGTSFGQVGFGGACPPPGDRPHRYVFTVYALKVDSLGLDASATPALVGYYLNSNVLDKASIMAYYGR